MIVRILGIEEATRELGKLAKGVHSAGETRVMVGTNLAYGYGIETGRHRGGRLARRAGGAFMLTRALREEQDSIKREIVQALDNGDAAVRATMLKKGHDIQKRAQGYTPVRTGSLRRSIHTLEVR